MKLLAFLVALSLTGFCTAEWKNLYLTYTLLLDGYFPIDLTLDELTEGDWNYMATDSELNVDFYSYGSDPRVSIGFDTYGNIAGVRVSFIIEDLDKRAKKNGVAFNYTYSDKPIFSNATYLDQDVYYTTVLFASPEKLAKGGREDPDGVLADNIYVKVNGTYTVMPKKESEATSLGFVKQACFYGMGQHYFLGMSPTSECNDLQGVFLLYHDSELVGMGLIPFGTHTTDERDWFEDPSAYVASLIAPNSPTCLGEWITAYGTNSIHFFFTKHPRFTTC